MIRRRIFDSFTRIFLRQRICTRYLSAATGINDTWWFTWSFPCNIKGYRMPWIDLKILYAYWIRWLHTCAMKLQVRCFCIHHMEWLIPNNLPLQHMKWYLDCGMNYDFGILKKFQLGISRRCRHLPSWIHSFAVIGYWARLRHLLHLYHLGVLGLRSCKANEPIDAMPFDQNEVQAYPIGWILRHSLCSDIDHVILRVTLNIWILPPMLVGPAKIFLHKSSTFSMVVAFERDVLVLYW